MEEDNERISVINSSLMNILHSKHTNTDQKHVQKCEWLDQNIEIMNMVESKSDQSVVTSSLVNSNEIAS